MADRPLAALFALAVCLLAWGGAQAQTARFDRFTYSGHATVPVKVPPGDYANPILPGYYPDPSVTRVGDAYYLVNSSFAHFPGIPVFRSKDLVNWSQIGNAIDRPDQLDLSGRSVSEGVFAPDISFHAGLFYIVNTCVGCGGNFFITAKDAAGPWSRPVWLPFEGIDPSIYWEGEHAYIVNNRAPDEPERYEGHRAIWLQEFDWRAGRMVGPSTQLINGGVDLVTKPVWIEGPHLFRRGIFYYLLAAEGGTAENHSEVVFRSKNLRGPFAPFSGNPILTQRDLPPDRPHPVTSSGHAKFVETQRGEWWATFLATRPYADDRYNTGRETFLLPVTWANGWPIILKHGRSVPLVVPRPKLPPQSRPAHPMNGDIAYIDEFDGPGLSPQWIGIRAARKPFWRVAGGALELTSTAPFGDLDQAPAFIGRRQQHAIATFSTTMHFIPAKDGARAGLAAVQNDRSFLFLGVAQIAGKPVVELSACDKCTDEVLVASAPIDPTRPITLTIRVTGGTMAFDVQEGSGPPRTLKAGFDASLLSTKRAGGFVGTVVGPYVYNP